MNTFESSIAHRLFVGVGVGVGARQDTTAERPEKSSGPPFPLGGPLVSDRRTASLDHVCHGVLILASLYSIVCALTD